ncbi:MAG: hypothetical protein ABR915_22790 [Thermoguttaceae bacterium]
MADSPQAHFRWLRLTPDRLIVGLLALEGFLFASERFRWFGFNQHKGWTVLIAVAAVGAAILLILVWLAAALLFRPRLRFQYSIRSLLVLTVAVAVPCSWLSREMKRAREQKEAVAAIEKAGGYVSHDYEVGALGASIVGAEPPGPPWLRNLLGEEFLASVDYASPGTELESIKRLPQLRELYLAGARITDDGLAALGALTQLQVLILTGTGVSDAGLEHIRGLRQLQVLWLGRTGVTDSGLAHLTGMLRLQYLDLYGTKVTDAGLVHLAGLSRLDSLNLYCTHVTEKGVENLQRALPSCKIEH